MNIMYSTCLQREQAQMQDIVVKVLEVVLKMLYIDYFFI